MPRRSRSGRHQHAPHVADGDEVDYPSMLAFYEDFNEAAKRDQVISISNRVLPWDTTNGDTRDQFPGGRSAPDLSAGKGLEGIHYGEDLRAKSSQDFIAASTVNNSVCFIGPHRVYSPWSATYQELVPGQGRFGPDALPVRNSPANSALRLLAYTSLA